jgi:predicted N-acyltransferase
MIKMKYNYNNLNFKDFQEFLKIEKKIKSKAIKFLILDIFFKN